MLAGGLRMEFRDSVGIEPFSSQDSYGEPHFGASVTYPARVEVKSRRIAGSGGVEIAARGRVLLASIATVTTKDRMTLPNWAAPTQPPILDVQVHRGDGMDHTTVYFGA